MKTLKSPAIGLLVAMFLCPTVQADLPLPPSSKPEVTEGVPAAQGSNVFGRAVQWDRALTTTTGMAISPLLGMGVLGAVEWIRATEVERAALPWYTHPGVWGAALAIFGLSLLKDTFGVVVPEAVKKPLTVVEVLENKLSAVIVALAVIPASVAAQFPPIESMPSAGVSGGWPVVAALPVVAGIPVMAALLMVMAFTAVFLVSHACKCLLLLSPSSFITTGLRGLKGAFLVAFAGTAYVSPWAGLVFSLVIIVVCVVLSGWAFRWNVFGWLFVWDFLGSRFDREVGPEEPLKGFATGNLEGVKARTYGEIRRDGETWVFSYRPWLILPRREVRWSGGRTGLRAGLLAPALTLRKDGQKDFVTIFSFRLRFYRHADVLERRLGVDERQPSRVVQGARQAFAWLSEQISGGVSQETAGRLGAKP